MKNKKVDILLLIVFPVLASLITVVYKVNFLSFIILYFGIPLLYLALRNPGIVVKSFMFAFYFSIPLSLFVDTLAVLDQSWIIKETIFPFKFFGLATVEVYIYGLLWGFLAVLFYEHFFDRGRWKDRLSKNIKYLLYFFAFLVITVTVLFFVDTNLLKIPYFYLWVSLIFIIPPLIFFLYFYPKFLHLYILSAVYFFFILFISELTALETKQWIFPSNNFIGFAEVFKYRFPLEELFFWMIFATPSFLAYYEFFADDRK